LKDLHPNAVDVTAGPDANGGIVTVAENTTGLDTITVQIPRTLSAHSACEPRAADSARRKGIPKL
jgi:hypothetical protein